MLRRALSSVANTLDISTHQNGLIKSYLSKTSSLNLCLNNEKLASLVCTAIGDQLKDEKKFVFEASPGSGILTEQLLESGIPRLRVFEHNEKRLASLRKLQEKYGQRLEIVDKQILDFTNGNYKLLDISREDFFHYCFDRIPVQELWGKELNTSEDILINSSIQIITALSPSLADEFLRYLNYSLTHFDTFFCTGPTEFFLFLPLSSFRKMMYRPTGNLKMYVNFNILINSFFEYDTIDLPAQDLDGAEKTKTENKLHTVFPSKYFSYTNDRVFKSTEKFVFISLKPKPIINKLGPAFMENYFTFVRQSFTKRSNNAIKYYDRIFPGCGIDLLGLGISYYKLLGDLTHEEMFTIFSHLYRTPNYGSSIFGELSNS